MSALTHATLVAETAWHMTQGALPAVRVIPHDEEGKKPRGKAGQGTLIVASEGESMADVLRTVAGYLEQESHDWDAFTRTRMMPQS